MARKAHQAILLQDVEHLGRRATSSPSPPATCATTSCPAASAEQATDARIAEIKRQADQRAQAGGADDEQAQEIAHTLLNRTMLTIPARAGAEDRLYGSVTPADIADEIWRARKIRVDRRKVELDEPIKRLGTYQVDDRGVPRGARRASRRWSCRRGLDFDAEEATRRRGVRGRAVRTRSPRTS